MDLCGYLLPGLAAGKSGEDLEPPARTLRSCGMPQAISWIMEFPLCFLGEMMGEINRKNIVTNPSRCHDSLLGPGQPLRPPPRRWPRGSAVSSLLRRFEIPGRTPHSAAGLWGRLGACTPSSSTHLSQARQRGFPKPSPPFLPTPLAAPLFPQACLGGFVLLAR